MDITKALTPEIAPYAIITLLLLLLTSRDVTLRIIKSILPEFKSKGKYEKDDNGWEQVHKNLKVTKSLVEKLSTDMDPEIGKWADHRKIQQQMLAAMQKTSEDQHLIATQNQAFLRQYQASVEQQKDLVQTLKEMAKDQDESHRETVEMLRDVEKNNFSNWQQLIKMLR